MAWNALIGVLNIVYLKIMAKIHTLRPSERAVSPAQKNQPDGYAGLDGEGHMVAAIHVRKGTRSQLSNVVLAEGEIAYATDLKKYYGGDGVTAGGLFLGIGGGETTTPVGVYRFVTTANSSSNSCVVDIKTTTGHGAITWWDGSTEIQTSGDPDTTFRFLKTNSTDTAPKVCYVWSCSAPDNSAQSGDITHIDAQSRKFTESDTSKLYGLTYLGLLATSGEANAGVIGSIDLTSQTLLETIIIDNQGLTHVYTGSHPNATLFSCDGNTDLSGVDFSGMPNLEILRARDTNLPASLDGLPKLTEYSAVNSGAVGEVDTANNPLLTRLEISGGITSLDATGSPLLSRIDVSGSPSLTSLNASGLTSLGNLYVSDCPNLADISVPDTIGWVTNNGDGCPNLDFENDFPNLTVLSMESSTLTSVQWGGLTSLTILNISGSPALVPDLSSMVTLEHIHMWGCNLTSIDLTALSNLETANIQDNDIVSLDLSGNPALTTLNMSGNSAITTLDLSGLPNLSRLTVYGCQSLASITNIGGAPSITDIFADDCGLTGSISLPLPLLNDGEFADNNLTSVDMTGCGTNANANEKFDFKNNDLDTDAVYAMLDSKVGADNTFQKFFYFEGNPAVSGGSWVDGSTHTAAQLRALITAKKFYIWDVT